MGSEEARRSELNETIYYQEREAEIYDLEYQWKTDDIEYWIALANEYAGGEGTALELACGTGRVLLPIAESGVRVVGIDQSPWMLKKAKEKLESKLESVQERVGLLEADMRTVQLEQKFEFIYLPFNTFLILRTVDDQLAVFETVRRHLAPGGVFAFEMFVPDVNRLASKERPLKWGNEVDQTLGDLGVRLQRDSLTRFDLIRQQIFSTFRIREYRDHVLQREFINDLQLTYIFPRELEHLVARAGFEFVHFWGNYDRVAEFWSVQEPQRQLPVVRPKNNPPAGRR
jgi:ubiquinone/menaquinone biosynthesis C-methylase UbiE